MVVCWLIPEFWSKNILLNTHSNENMRKRNENRNSSELIFQNFAKISGAPKNGGRIGELPSLRFCFVCEMLFCIAAIGCAFFFWVKCWPFWLSYALCAGSILKMTEMLAGGNGGRLGKRTLCLFLFVGACCSCCVDFNAALLIVVY